MCALDVSARAEPDAPLRLAGISEFFDSRAAQVDAGQATVREGLAFLGQLGFAGADIVESIRLVSTVARSDMATAFSAWAHRMVIDYVSLSSTDSSARSHLTDLAVAHTLGATALAAGTAHVYAGAPLPVTFRIEGDEIILDGRIPWASNLIAPFLVVTAAANADDPSQTIVVAFTDATIGLEAAAFPELLALGATGSTTVKLSGARVPRSYLVADDVHTFVHSVVARFLLLQSAFCDGLARRSFEEATANLPAMGESLRPQLDVLAADLAHAEAETERLAEEARIGRASSRQELFAIRLRWSELAATAVHLELAAAGGRGYLSQSGTARRVREAAFLPVQAPTEVLLRWLLTRSA